MPPNRELSLSRTIWAQGDIYRDVTRVEFSWKVLHLAFISAPFSYSWCKTIWIGTIPGPWFDSNFVTWIVSKTVTHLSQKIFEEKSVRKMVPKITINPMELWDLDDLLVFHRFSIIFWNYWIQPLTKNGIIKKRPKIFNLGPPDNFWLICCDIYSMDLKNLLNVYKHKYFRTCLFNCMEVYSRLGMTNPLLEF